MDDVQIRITGDKELVGKINAFIGSGGLNLKREMGAWGLYLTRFFSGDVFVSRGRVINESWPRLSASYAAYKARLFPGSPPLVLTGEMMGGFKFKEEKLSLSLWNSSDYFDYHQEGRGVPKRVMMKIDEQRAARGVKYIVGGLDDQMRAKGLL